MAKRHRSTEEDSLFKVIFASEMADMAKLKKKQQSFLGEEEGTQDDVELWKLAKYNSLINNPNAELTSEMRKFLAYMDLKLGKTK